MPGRDTSLKRQQAATSQRNGQQGRYLWPNQTEDMDHVDVELIDLLRENGRLSNRQLAASVGVNENAVGARLRKLEAKGVLRVIAVTDTAAVGHPFLFFAKIQVTNRPVAEVGAEFAQFPQVIGVILTKGRFNLILTVLADNLEMLNDLITTRLPAVPGVERLRPEVALEVFRFRTDLAALGAPVVPMPPMRPNERVDPLDLAIIDELQNGARTSNNKIATRLGTSEGTIRTRIRRLIEDRVIWIRAVCDSSVGVSAHAILGIDVNAGQIHRVADEIVGLAEASVVVSTIGDYDVVVVVSALSWPVLSDLVRDRIGSIDAVRRIETIDMLDVIKHSYTWARLV